MKGKFQAIKKQKIVWGIGGIILFVFFVGLIGIKVKNINRKTPIALEEICCSLQFYELDKEEWYEVLADKVSEKLTYKDMKTILGVLGIRDYISFPKEWKDKKMLTAENYYTLYEEILSILDTEGVVKKQTITVNNVYKVTDEQGVISSETYIFRVSFGFSRYIVGNSYEVYSMGMEILGGIKTETKSGNVDFSDASIRVLLSYGGKCEWLPEAISIELKGNYKLYFNNSYIMDVSDTIISVKDFFKTSELGIHHSLGNQMELLPCEEENRFIIRYNGESTNPYRGKIGIYPKEKTCFLVNELSVEKYLYSVVPSEMPASYELEALKAQAICARSYAYQHLLCRGRMDYYAHVDDTTSYQVYNKTAEQERTNLAVDDTKGMYITYKGNVASTYYFSTSIGNTAGRHLWGLGEEYSYLASASKYGIYNLSDEKSFQKFIDACPTDDYESDCRYYRWNGTIQLDKDKIMERIANRIKVDQDFVNRIPEASWGELTSIYVKERDGSGGIKQLALVYGKEEIVIQGEYNIRYCLGACDVKIKLLNDETIDVQMLPSSFFYIKEVKGKTCKIVGGGYGHGLGMSQNGANGMAKTGYTYKEVLNFYFTNCQIKE